MMHEFVYADLCPCCGHIIVFMVLSWQQAWACSLPYDMYVYVCIYVYRCMYIYIYVYICIFIYYIFTCPCRMQELCSKPQCSEVHKPVTCRSNVTPQCDTTWQAPNANNTHAQMRACLWNMVGSSVISIPNSQWTGHVITFLSWRGLNHISICTEATQGGLCENRRP